MLNDLEIETKNGIKNYLLKKYSLKVPDDWLSQCVEFITQTFPNQSINNYIDLVYKQLIDFDLALINTSCLPSKIFSTESGFIEGNFFLQVNLCLDANQSLFTQIQNLKGEINENAFVDAENVPTHTQYEKKDAKKNRLIAIHLTDGTSFIKAFEYKYISVLNETILPGTKIHLRGKIQFRNAVLYLGPENLELLNGHIEEITTMENLIQSLKQDLENKISDNSQTISDRERSKHFDTSNNKLKSEIESNNKQKFDKCNYNIKRTNNGNEKYNQKCINSSANEILLDNEDDDDLLMMCDLATLEKSATKPSTHSFKEKNRNVSQPTSMKRLLSLDKINDCWNDNQKLANEADILKKNFKKPKVNEMMAECFCDDDDDDFMPPEGYLKKSTNKGGKISNVKTELFKSENFQPKMNPKSNENFIQMDFATLDSIFEDELKDELSNSVLNLSDLIKESFINSCCKHNIDKSDNQKNLFNLSTCTHQINGQFYSMKSSLRQIKCASWYQECTVTDGLTYADVYIGNGPLEMLLEMSCKQAVELYKQSRSSNLPPHQNQYNILFEKKRKKCENSLEKMTCTMQFKYDFERKTFCIYKLENIKYNLK